MPQGEGEWNRLTGIRERKVTARPRGTAPREPAFASEEEIPKRSLEENEERLTVGQARKP